MLVIANITFYIQLDFNALNVATVVVDDKIYIKPSVGFYILHMLAP